MINASFGPESLSVYNYEEHKKNLAELFFGTVLGYRVNVEEIGTVNRSLSKKEIELLRLFNRYSEGNAADAGSFVGDALMALPPIGNEVFLPSEEDVRFLEDRFGASLDRLNKIVTGRKVKISTGFGGDSESIELSEFERFSMAVLARLVQRAVQ